MSERVKKEKEKGKWKSEEDNLMEDCVKLGPRLRWGSFQTRGQET